MTTPTAPLFTHSLALDIGPATSDDHAVPPVISDVADVLGPFHGIGACSCYRWSSGSVFGDRQWVDDTIRADHARHVATQRLDGHDYSCSTPQPSPDRDGDRRPEFSVVASCSCHSWWAAYTGDTPEVVTDRAAAGHLQHVEYERNALPAWTRDWSAVVDNNGRVTTTRPELADRLRAAGLDVTVIGRG